jgi:thiaminase/transcriptional activator TenA
MSAAVKHRPEAAWSGQLWLAMEPTYHAILEHPFLTGLQDGTLATEAFAHYLIQDLHYLRDYARCLTVVGSKALLPGDTAMFARHAAGTAEAESQMHESLLPALGLKAGDAMMTAVMAPTTRAYTSYLLATAHGGSFAEGLAAILPCYWIYARVGEALASKGSPHPQYQAWIDTYSGQEYWAIVDEMLDLVDRIGTTLAVDERVRADEHLKVTARYEWMFWDAAYRSEQWPLGGLK